MTPLAPGCYAPAAVDPFESNTPKLRTDLPSIDLAPGGSRALEVFLPQFEGPLDLLLHLVRSQDMDILDIQVYVIARQYNEFLDAMRQLNLEIASEYLVMAATLAHIKSRLMLPPETAEDGQPTEDPRAELSRALLEYERYRKAAEELSALESGRDLVFARPGQPPADLAGAYTMRVDLHDLVRAFERVIARLEAGDGVELIRREEFKIQDMMERIVSSLRTSAALSFRAVLASCRTRLERVVVFLALLELVKLGAVAVWQESPRSDILLESTVSTEETH